MNSENLPDRRPLAALPDVANQWVTVEARVTAVSVVRPGTSDERALVTITADGDLADVHVNQETWDVCFDVVQVGAQVVVFARVIKDVDGVYLAAHTIYEETK